MEREEPSEENEYRCKSFVKPEELHLKSSKNNDCWNDEIKENIRLKIGDDTEDYTNRVNGDNMDTNVIEHQKRDQENENTDFGKVEITNIQVLKESNTQLRIS